MFKLERVQTVTYHKPTDQRCLKRRHLAAMKTFPAFHLMTREPNNQVSTTTSPVSRVMVTGTPRSGTTWVGHVLSAKDDTLYVHEPFNPNYPSAYTPLRLKNWFERLDLDANHKADRQLRALLDLKIRGCSIKLADFRYPRTLARRVTNCIQGMARQSHFRSIVIKDPIAAFSADVICERYDMKPIFMYRNPTASVSSMMIRGWRTDFTQLYAQRKKLESIVPDEIVTLERLAGNPDHSLLENATHLWRIINLCILHFLEMHPEWVHVRHEDLIKDPINRFKDMFKQCELEWTESHEQLVKRSIVTEKPGSKDRRPDVFNIKRNHSQLQNIADERLSADQIARIEELTGDVTELFAQDSSSPKKLQVAG